jgi:hypothetical protein
LIGGGGVDGSGGTGGGSSYSSGYNTFYTTGYSTGDGSVTVEFYSKPTFRFTCTQSVQNLTVPAGYDFMSVDVVGAAAGSGGIGTPGYGARVQSYLSVTPGDLLHVVVGCPSANCPSPSFTPPAVFPGGYNGGGAGYGHTTEDLGATGGGGASDIRMGGLSLTNRVVIAGGGGGIYCGTACGNPKGGDAGQFGQPGSVTALAVCYGRNKSPSLGGNWTSGGPAGGAAGFPYPTFGTLGFGGNGGYSQSPGGGGGYYGGKN